MLGWGAELVDWKDSDLPAQDERPAPDPGMELISDDSDSAVEQASQSATKRPSEEVLQPAETQTTDVLTKRLNKKSLAINMQPSSATSLGPKDIGRCPMSELERCTSPRASPATVRLAEVAELEDRLMERGRQHAVARAAMIVMLSQSHPQPRFLNWRWDEETDDLRCPADQPFKLRRIRPQSVASDAAWFHARDRHACRNCALRSECTTSTNPNFRKELTVTVRSGAGRTTSPRKSRKVITEQTTYGRPYRLAASEPTSPGPKQAAAPALVPAVLRNAVHETFGSWRGRALWPALQASRRPPRWMTSSEAQRQRRRQTWQQRRQKVVSGSPQLLLYHPDAGVTSQHARRVLLTVKGLELLERC